MEVQKLHDLILLDSEALLHDLFSRWVSTSNNKNDK